MNAVYIVGRSTYMVIYSFQLYEHCHFLQLPLEGLNGQRHPRRLIALEQVVRKLQGQVEEQERGRLVG